MGRERERERERDQSKSMELDAACVSITLLRTTLFQLLSNVGERFSLVNTALKIQTTNVRMKMMSKVREHRKLTVSCNNCLKLFDFCIFIFELLTHFYNEIILFRLVTKKIFIDFLTLQSRILSAQLVAYFTFCFTKYFLLLLCELLSRLWHLRKMACQGIQNKTKQFD